MFKGILQTVVTIVVVIVALKVVKPYVPTALAAYLP